MYIPKHYGQSRIEKCPFCERQGTIKNSQGIPTCTTHKNLTLDDLKCVCGRYVLAREGKYGVFFTCTNCGNINLRKVLEINSGAAAKVLEKNAGQTTKGIGQSGPKKEIIIRSDELDFYL